MFRRILNLRWLSILIALWILTACNPSSTGQTSVVPTDTPTPPLPIAASERMPLIPTPTVEYRADSTQISIFDPALREWLDYPYPFETHDNVYVTRNGNGTLRMQICWLNGYRQDFQPVECYRDFDPQTGEFSTPESVCGEYLPHPNDTRWIGIGSSFCNITTGEYSEQVPMTGGFRFITELGIEESPVFPRTAAYPNPTGDWLVFSEGSRNPTVYAFQRHTSEFNTMGNYTEDYSRGDLSVTWLDDHRFTFSNDGILYSADVRLVNSLTEG